MAISILSLIASGCASQRTIVDISGARAVSTNSAFATLGPGSPAVLSVIESHYANATRQKIALATRGRTPGENHLRIDVFGVTNTDVGPGTTLADPPWSEADLLAEGQDALPDVPLSQSLNYLQNRYGPFGYLVGKSAQGDVCVYAWQRLATPDQKLSLVNWRVALSVRLRLCDPEATEAALIATMMNLSVNVRPSSGSWSPDPEALSVDMGAAGAPIAPPSIMTAAANPFSPAPSDPRPPSRAKRAMRAPSPEPTPAAASVPPAVVVPPPPLASLNAPSPGLPDAAPLPERVDAPPSPREARP